MSITFKEFDAAVQMTDEEFNKIQEGLSDMPGFGWLKSIGDNPAKKKAALLKINAERQKLQKLKTTKAKELDAALAAFAAGTKPQQKGVVSHDDLESALSPDDRRINARMDKARDANAAHVRRNLGMAD
jgi:hypothetical protein